MPTIKAIKERRTAIKRIRKITYAMQIVASTRLNRTKQRVLDARDYHKKIRQILSDIITRSSEIHHPLLEDRTEVKTIGLIMVNSDRGLCGGFNNNVFTQIQSFMKVSSAKEIKFIALGRKAQRFLRSQRKENILKTFFDVEKEGLRKITEEIATDIINLYTENKLDEIYLVYNEYRMDLLGKATLLKVLPVEPEASYEPEKEMPTDYLYEPSTQEVLSVVLPQYVEEQVYHAALESRVSEEMARMVSMKMATDNADDMIKSLSLAYHKARQELITRELTEIASAI